MEIYVNLSAIMFVIDMRPELYYNENLNLFSILKCIIQSQKKRIIFTY